MSFIEESLGKTLSVKEVASIFDVDTRVVRKHYQRLGGIKISTRKIVFFEKEVVNAIQAQRRLSWTDQVVRWKQKSENDQVIQNQEGSGQMGSNREGKVVRVYDEHGIFWKLGNKVP